MPGTLTGLGLTCINKYDTKTASRWQQVSVLMSDSLNRSFNDLFKTADLFRMNQVTIFMNVISLNL